MKKLIFKLSLCVAFIFFQSDLIAQRNKKNDEPEFSMEEVKAKCPNRPREERVRVKVSNFSVETSAAPGTLGKEMREMLESSLQQINCFNVLVSDADMDDMDGEISDMRTGRGDASNSPQSGKMKGAQVIVKGKVTEYATETAKNSVRGVSFTSSKKAHVGFVLKLFNAETRELIASKQFDIDGKTAGKGGFSIGGVYSRESDNAGKNSLQDLMQDGINQAVVFMVNEKDQFDMPESAATTKAKKQETTLADCQILKGSKIPKVMVILPEYHITRRIPDPAAETEINRKLLEFGFEVVDAAMYATIANGDRFSEAAKDPKLAISLGKEFGADIVIYGEAFSELGNGAGRNQVSCRARVEVKAVRTDNASMLAANGMEAGGIDNVESVASKTALRNAGSQVADYMIEQLCKRSFTK